MFGVDLFAGAGGMSLGAAGAGIDVKYAIDSDRNAVETYAANHKDTEVDCESISEIDDFRKYKPDGEFVLFGGPPCQGFSTSNQKTRNTKNPVNWMFKHFVRAVEQLGPKIVVFENVRGLIETADKFFLLELIQDLAALGYESRYRVLNAKDFGIPQNRSRLFLIATNNGVPISFPHPLKQKPVEVGEAISDLPCLSNGQSSNLLPYQDSPKSEYAQKMRGNLNSCDGHEVSRNAEYILERYRHIPPGGNWQDIPEELMGNYTDRSRCHTGIYRRLKMDEPSVVIGNYRKNMLIHPCEHRGLSVREAARIQSFPDSFSFKGSIGFKQQQVGNAVPPLLAEQVFSSILEYAHRKIQ